MLLHLLRATRLFRHERDGSLGQICQEKRFPHPSPHSKYKEPEGPYRALLHPGAEQTETPAAT